MTTLEVNSFVQAKIFIPHFHDSLTWPPAGERLLLPVVLLKSHPVLSPRGCGCLPKCRSAWIRAVGSNWSHKVEGKKTILPSLPQWPCKGGGILSCSSVTLRDIRGCLSSPGVPENSCAWYQEDFWICPCFYQDCVRCAGLLVSVALSCPALQKHFPAGNTLLLSWKAGALPFLHPECSSKESSLFASIRNFEWNYSAGHLCSK